MDKKKGGENSAKNSQKSQFSGFLPLKIILIMSFIILIQSGFYIGDIALELGPGDFYSYNEIILIGIILMVSVDWYKNDMSS